MSPILARRRKHAIKKKLNKLHRSLVETANSKNKKKNLCVPQRSPGFAKEEGLVQDRREGSTCKKIPSPSRGREPRSRERGLQREDSQEIQIAAGKKNTSAPR